jgi:2,5-diketo-D-gluconate reductase A
MTTPTITLGEGVDIPQVGFGVFQIPPQEVHVATEHALSIGYRHIDTAAAYNNEVGVGRAVRTSNIPRDEIFITTKLRNGDQGYDSTLAAFERSQEALGLDVIDLYLIHWPYPRHGLYLDSWRAMESLLADGVVRAIGVSNFLPEHLDLLAAEATIAPALNQIEVHPSFAQRALREGMASRGIAVQAYSPLGQGADLDNEVVHGVADAHGVTPAQVVLRWHTQQGTIVIPKSVSPERMTSNLDIFDFTLSTEELSAIDGLDTETRIGGDPATFDSPQG